MGSDAVTIDRARMVATVAGVEYTLVEWTAADGGPAAWVLDATTPGGTIAVVRPGRHMCVVPHREDAVRAIAAAWWAADGRAAARGGEGAESAGRDEGE